jgi:hypothetical protein
MGASGWWYRYEHQTDLAAALHELQQAVFTSGDYYKVWENHPNYLQGWAADLPMMVETMPDAFPPEVYDQAMIDGMAAGEEPATIEQARLWAMDSGTHSILDIDGVSESPEPAMVSPLTETEAEQLFGSSEPTVDSIESRQDELLALPVGAWTGRYIVAFENGAPAALFFFGISGD